MHTPTASHNASDQDGRRQFLQTLAALGVGLVPQAFAPALAKPARASDFAAALSGQPLLTPFKGVTDISGDCDTPVLATTGHWPAGLRGRFYRNGPALYERGSERYHHWFDGDGMVQQFSIGDGRVAHRGRLVRTAKLQAEQQAGRFLYGAFGTSIEDAPVAAPASGPDSYNTANTNAIEHAGRVLAMWEGGSAYAMDPADLSSRGPVVWRKDLAGVPFSAHPKLDARGHLWNIGTSGSRIVAWHIGPDGQLVNAQVATSPFPGGMVHDMAVTERWLVVPLPPVKLHFDRPQPEGPRRFALEPGEPLRVLVMDKNDITRQRVFELPAELVFHIGNAHEERDGAVVLSYVGAHDVWFLNQGAVDVMRGVPSPPGAVHLRSVRLDMASGRATQATLPGEVEFPRIDPRRIGGSGDERARWLLTGAAWKAYPGRRHALLHGVQLTHLDSGRQRRFDYGEHVAVEEHILVPKPGRRGELDAWLLGTTFDARRQATLLNLLDASRIEDGPIAQAALPYVLPLGFHGNFTPA
ncbi:MAG: carotenoid oxygenase family protein [Chitinophagaceae bacterium]|nr:carotenoid oxygenase family protein [Rubrivivax sp.]